MTGFVGIVCVKHIFAKYGDATVLFPVAHLLHASTLKEACSAAPVLQVMYHLTNGHSVSKLTTSCETYFITTAAPYALAPFTGLLKGLRMRLPSHTHAFPYNDAQMCFPILTHKCAFPNLFTCFSLLCQWVCSHSPQCSALIYIVLLSVHVYIPDKAPV